MINFDTFSPFLDDDSSQSYLRKIKRRKWSKDALSIYLVISRQVY
ncbi:MAG: hypothetical protein ABIJ03_02900 [Patescibacteria group bacterium]